MESIEDVLLHVYLEKNKFKLDQSEFFPLLPLWNFFFGGAW